MKSIFSIVFSHTESKRIYLWMDHADDIAHALLSAQQEFERAKLDPSKMEIIIQKEMYPPNGKPVTTRRLKPTDPNYPSNIEEYEEWKEAEQRRSDEVSQEEARKAEKKGSRRPSKKLPTKRAGRKGNEKNP